MVPTNSRLYAATMGPLATCSDKVMWRGIPSFLCFQPRQKIPTVGWKTPDMVKKSSFRAIRVWSIYLQIAAYMQLPWGPYASYSDKVMWRGIPSFLCFQPRQKIPTVGWKTPDMVKKSSFRAIRVWSIYLQIAAYMQLPWGPYASYSDKVMWRGIPSLLCFRPRQKIPTVGWVTPDNLKKVWVQSCNKIPN